MNTKKKVYAFYITIIALAVLAMMMFDLNLMAKSILCLIVFSVCWSCVVFGMLISCPMILTPIQCSLSALY